MYNELDGQRQIEVRETKQFAPCRTVARWECPRGSLHDAARLAYSDKQLRYHWRSILCSTSSFHESLPMMAMDHVISVLCWRPSVSQGLPGERAKDATLNLYSGRSSSGAIR